MNYLPKLPSVDDVKGFFTGAKEYLENAYDTHYPVVRDSVKDYANRSYVYIKEKAIENPVAAFAIANAGLAFISFKIVAFVHDKLHLNDLDKERNPNKKDFSKPVAAVFAIACGAGVAGVNYVLYHALELTAKVAGMVFGGVALLTAAAALMVVRSRASEQKRHTELCVELSRRMNDYSAPKDERHGLRADQCLKKFDKSGNEIKDVLGMFETEDDGEGNQVNRNRNLTLKLDLSQPDSVDIYQRSIPELEKAIAAYPEVKEAVTP